MHLVHALNKSVVCSRPFLSHTFMAYMLKSMSRSQFRNTLIWLKFNPIYFMQKYTYFKL